MDGCEGPVDAHTQSRDHSQVMEDSETLSAAPVTRHPISTLGYPQLARRQGGVQQACRPVVRAGLHYLPYAQTGNLGHVLHAAPAKPQPGVARVRGANGRKVGGSRRPPHAALRPRLQPAGRCRGVPPHHGMLDHVGGQPDRAACMASCGRLVPVGMVFQRAHPCGAPDSLLRHPIRDPDDVTITALGPAMHEPSVRSGTFAAADNLAQSLLPLRDAFEKANRCPPNLASLWRDQSGHEDCVRLLRAIEYVAERARTLARHGSEPCKPHVA